MDLTKSNIKPEFHPNSTEEWDKLIGNVYKSNNGENINCKIKSECCSSEMSPYEDLCRWHYARMAQWEWINCDCRNNIACDGDSVGRLLFRKYYDIDIMATINLVREVSCCPVCDNTDNYVGRCGYMRICEEHKDLHDPQKRVLYRNYNENKTDEAVENGAIKVLTKNVLGVKHGKGFKVYVRMSNENIEIKTYVDAMKVHIFFVETEDSRSYDWLIISSHMGDRPAYVTPIIIPDLVYA